LQRGCEPVLFAIRALPSLRSRFVPLCLPKGRLSLSSEIWTVFWKHLRSWRSSPPAIACVLIIFVLTPLAAAVLSVCVHARKRVCESVSCLDTACVRSFWLECNISAEGTKESVLVSGKPLAANGGAPDAPPFARLVRLELLLSSFPSVGSAYG